MKDINAGSENITTGTLVLASAMNRLHLSLYDGSEHSKQEMKKVKREFSKDLRCAVRHFEAGFDQLTGHEG